jgi:hypothetical protein
MVTSSLNVNRTSWEKERAMGGGAGVTGTPPASTLAFPTTGD